MPLNTAQKSHNLNSQKVGRREFSTSTNSKPQTYNQLGSYLAGLIEGDGSLYTAPPGHRFKC